MLTGVFPKGVFTVNFANGYHQDPRDGDCLTYSTLTTPNKFLPQNKQIGVVFGFGSAVFDISQANLNLIFSGKNSSHITGYPNNVPSTPDILKGNKAHIKVVQKEFEIKDFLAHSAIAWAGFGRTNVGKAKAKASLFKNKKRSLDNGRDLKKHKI